MGYKLNYTGGEINSLLNKINDIEVPTKISDLSNDSDFVDSAFVEEKVQKLLTNTELKFLCSEPVKVIVNEDVYEYEANTLVDMFFKNNDNFSIETTSDKSILTLSA